jgi:hypothetical protein
MLNLLTKLDVSVKEIRHVFKNHPLKLVPPKNAVNPLGWDAMALFIYFYIEILAKFLF